MAFFVQWWQNGAMRLKLVTHLLGAIVGILLATQSVIGKTYTWELPDGRNEFELELDAYYSAVDFIGSLTKDSIPNLQPGVEGGLYRTVAMGALNPRFFIVELSFNPLPFGGAIMRSEAPGAYDRFRMGRGNAIQSLTAGFPEPWAASFFLGNVVNFVSGDSSQKITGKGYSGILASVGNYHLLSGHFVKDYWAEGELKLKGSDVQDIRRLSWSFRIGGRIHDNPDILNTLYLSLKRDRVDYGNSEYDSQGLRSLLFRNSEAEVRVDWVVPKDPRIWNYFASATGLVGKKWPSADRRWALSLGLGLRYQADAGYRGVLRDWAKEQTLSFLIRPNLVF